MFQFYISTIIPLSALRGIPPLACFNSILVRLYQLPVYGRFFEIAFQFYISTIIPINQLIKWTPNLVSILYQYDYTRHTLNFFCLTNFVSILYQYDYTLLILRPLFQMSRFNSILVRLYLLDAVLPRYVQTPFQFYISTIIPPPTLQAPQMDFSFQFYISTIIPRLKNQRSDLY